MTGSDEAPALVLASTSPRRASILEQLGLSFRVVPSGVSEGRAPGELPGEAAERLARGKAQTVRELHPDALVLAGDTLVVAGGEILEKPADDDEALATLLRLSGRSHRVATALALAAPDGRLVSEVSWTEVFFRPFDTETAERYVGTGEPLDKAGSYGIQGRGAALVRALDGDYYTVVGLPVVLLVELLEEVGWRYGFPGIVPVSRR